MASANNSLLFRSIGMVNTVRRSKVLAAILFIITCIMFLAKPEGDMTLMVMYVLGFLIVVSIIDILDVIGCHRGRFSLTTFSSPARCHRRCHRGRFS